MAIDFDKVVAGDFTGSIDKSKEASPSTATPTAPKSGSDKQAFLDQYAPVFQKIGDRLGVNPNMIGAQLGIETGWGKHIIGGTNNLGNIKDFSGGGVDAKDNMLGTTDKYRKFNTVDDFADHYSQLMARKFPNVLGAGDDVKQFADGLHGYAQDPHYANKIIDTYNNLEGIQSSPATPFKQYVTSNTAELNRKAASDKETLSDAGGHGFDTAMEQLPQLAGGAAAFLGDAVGNDWLKHAGLDYYKEKSDDIASKAKDYEDVGEALKSGQLGKWLAYAGGYTVAQIAQAVATGGIGAMVAKAGVKNLLANTAEKAAAEYVEQNAAKAALASEQHAISSGMDAAAAKAGANNVYKTALTDPKALAMGETVGKTAQSVAASKFGAALGLGANSEMMEVGQIYPDAYDQAQKEGHDVDLGKVAGSATAAASLDVIPEMRVGNKLLGPAERIVEGAAKNTEHGLLGRVAREVPKQMAMEGGTEALQTPIETYGTGKDPFTPEGWNDIINSAAMGAVGGVIGGGMAAIPKTPQEVEAAKFQPNSPLGNASASGTPTQPLHPSNGFGDPRLDSMHADIVNYINNRDNIAALRNADKTLPQEAFYVWNNVVNNQNLPLATRANALEQAHSMMMHLPNFTLSGDKAEAAAPNTALTVPDQNTAVGAPAQKMQFDPTIEGDFINHARTINRTGVQDNQSFTNHEQAQDVNDATSAPLSLPFDSEKEKLKLSNENISNAFKNLQQTSAAKRHDAIRGLVGQGFNTIDDKNNLVHPVTGHALPLTSPADIQVARQAIRKQVDTGAHEAASSPNNELPAPTEKQIEAENYKKGHVNIHGIDIAIENPQGSTRSGVDQSGKAWESKLAHHYGYVKGTTGADGDAVDVFVGHNPASSKVFVVDQIDPATGKFDEHKVMMGFNHEDEAYDAYHANYDKDWKGHGEITEMSMPEFKEWLKSGSKSPVAYKEFKGGQSEQYKRYEKWINENNHIPKGMLEQIAADERLEEGEADSLIRLAQDKNAKTLEGVIDTNKAEDNKPAEKAEPEPVAESISTKADNKKSREWIRPEIVLLVNQKANASQIGKRDQMDKIVELAKQYMNGGDVKPARIKTLGMAFEGEAVMKPIIDRVYEGIKADLTGQAKADKAAAKGKTSVTLEDVKKVVDTSTDEGNVKDTPEVHAEKLSRDVQRRLFNTVANSDAAIASVKKGEDGFYEAAKKLVKSALGKMEIDGDVGGLTVDNIPSQFWNALYRKSKRIAELSEKEKNQDPEIYKQQLAKSAVEAGVNMDDPAYLDNFKEGFDHALKGKSKSTLTTGLVDIKLDGYQAAWSWIKTEEGKAWFEGKRKLKLKDTGADLKRWFEAARTSINDLDDSDPIKVYATIKKLTERAKVFNISLAPDATFGAKAFADELRSKVRPFNEYVTEKGFLNGLFGSTWRKTPEQLIQGYLNGTAYFHLLSSDLVQSILSNEQIESLKAEQQSGRRFEGDKSNEILSADKRSALLKAAAVDWINNVSNAAEAFSGARTVQELADKVASYFYKEGDTISYTDKGLYFDSNLTTSKFRVHHFVKDGYYVKRYQADENKEPVNNRATPLTPPRLDKVVRSGLTDYRNGENVTPQQFKEKFNFADVGFGGYVSSKQDQDHLNYAYDGFMDLAKLLNIKSTDIGFGGKLYFTIGALGHGKHAAHFAHGQPHPDGSFVEVINITNTKGDGTLAHEWFHALDYYLGKGNMSLDGSVLLLVDALSRKYDVDYLNKVPDLFLSGGLSYKLGKNATKLDQARYAIQNGSYGQKVQTQFKKDADELGADYWGNKKELLARAAEAWVYDTMGDKKNGYLVNGWVADGVVSKESGYRGTPYPMGNDRTRFAKLFDSFVKALSFTDGVPAVDRNAFKVILDAEYTDFQDAKSDLVARLPEIYGEIKEKERLARLNKLAEQNSYAEPSAAVEEAKRREQMRLQAEAEAALANASLPDQTVTEGPLSDDELNAIFDAAENELDESNQESINSPNMGDAMVGELTESNEPSKETVSQLLADAAKLGLTGMDEALTGLVKLFGGGSGRLNSFPAGFDEDAYNKAKPHFKAALESSQKLGLTLQELFKRLIQLFGAGIRPYAIQFAKEEGLGVSLANKENNDAISDEKQTVADDRNGNEEPSTSHVSGTESGEQASGSSDEQGDRSGRDLRDYSGATTSADNGESESGLPESGTAIDARPEPSLRGSTQAGGGVSTRGNDYTAGIGTLTREGSWRDTAKRNLDIIELVKKLDAEKRLATPEEQELISKFTGWGASEIRNNLFSGQSTGTSRILNPQWAKPDWRELVQRAKDLLTPEEIETAMQSTQYAHYTSERVIRSIWSGLSRMGFTGGRILEGGAGIGLFAVAAPKTTLEASRYTGIEMDIMSADIAKQLLQKQAIIQADFVKQKLPNAFFDLAIGNPPFANISIKDDPAYKKYGFMLHDYFFAKSIDKVRAGGILAFVTSKGTMDKAGDKARKFLAERADLIGAVRLPQTAFKDNAGTQVITDVLFLRKRAEGEAETLNPWMDLAEVTTADGHKFLINEYFVAHPEMVLGTHSTTSSQYNRYEYTVAPLDGDIEDHFDKAMQNLPAGIYTQFKPVDDIKTAAIERDFNPKASKEGSVYISDDGVLMRRESGSGVPLESLVTMSKREKKWMHDYVELRDATKQAQLDQLNDGDWEKSLKALNKAYDKFVKENGRIVKFTTYDRSTLDDDGNEIVTTYKRFKNNKLLRADVEGTLMMALERITEDDEIVKSPFLEDRTIKKHTRPVINGLNDALMVSLDELGKLNLDHVAELANMGTEQVINELGDLIYESPNGGWQLSDEYLSGDVLEKLGEAEAAAKIDPKYERNVKALLLAQPKPLSHDQINVMLGANWIPAQDVTAFANEVLDINTTVRYSPNTNVWAVDGADGHGSRRLRDSTAEFGTPYRSPHEILDDVLNGNQIKVTKTYEEDGKKKTVTDEAATALANEVAKKMRKAFGLWVWGDAHRAENLAALYNSKFNNIAPRKFDGSHLTLAGLSTRYKIFPHQLRAIWRIIQTGNTYLAHAVGAGKAQPLDAKVLTPNGFKFMGDIKVGDYVVSVDGKPTLVEAVFPQGEKEIFKVTFSDGSSTECCDEHLWKTHTYKERGYAQKAMKAGKDWLCAEGKVRSLSEIRETLIDGRNGAKNHSIPMVNAVDFNEQKLPLNPYLLGVLLGDGSMSSDHISLSSADPEIIELCTPLLPPNSQFNLKSDKDLWKCPTWQISRIDEIGYGKDMHPNPVVKELRALGLQGCKSESKFIPDIYKISSIDQRIALLQGLLDTDGSVSKSGHSVYYYTVSDRLADDVVYLINSLGGVVKRTIKKPFYTHHGVKKQGQDCHVLCISINQSINPFRLTRKASLVVPKTSYAPVRYIVSVDSVGMKQAQCIRVAHESHLYVTDDFIVTHNTLEMIISAMEQKRLGLITKPMFVVPNHMLDQFANEFLDAYPTANVMVADEKNFHTDNRRRFVSQAALNNPDAIVITHSAFGLIKTTQETNNVVVDELIAQLESSKDEEKDKRARARIESRIENIRRKFDSKASDDAKDQQITFEELGVDFLYVDEAHEFRKLDFVSNRGAIKGIDPNGSQKALGLFIKLRWLNAQRPNRAGVLASGTPVTNTMAELYTIMRYMSPDELEKVGLDHFDAWSNMFGEVSSNFEMNAAGKYEIVERFAKFVNVPELMKRVRMTMDVLTSSQLGGLVKRPVIKGGQPETVIVPASEATKNYLANELNRRITVSRAWKPSPSEKGNPDPLINIITDGRLSAIDMRFVDKNAENDPKSKLNAMIDDIIADHAKTRNIEFIDKNTGKKDSIKGATQIIFSAVGFGDQVAKSRGFDAKAWIAQRLKDEAGITNIAFMGDYKSAAKKEGLFKDMRSGKVTQLYGSPKNMGTGVNVQKRLKNLYFLSPPWYPADVEQPQGRIERQGNQNDEIEIKWYATKGTYDSTAWSMVSRKAKFIEQAFMGDDSVRTMEDVSEASQYEMASALASGDERAIQLAGYKADIERLVQLKQGHANTQIDLRHRKATTEFNIKRTKSSIENYKEAKELVGDYIYGDRLNATFGSNTYVNRAELGAALLASVNKAINKYDGKQIEEFEIGKAQGKFPIMAEVEASMKIVGDDKSLERVKSAKVFVQIGKVRQYLQEDYLSNYSELDASGFARRLENALNGVDKRLSGFENQLHQYDLEIKQVESKLGAPFPEERELSEKIAESANLEAEMLKGDVAVPSDEALLAMKDAKEAEEQAKVREIMDKYHFIIDPNGNVQVVVSGQDVSIPELPNDKFFVWKDGSNFSVTHAASSKQLAVGDSIESAIHAARLAIERHGVEKVIQLINESRQFTDAEKETAIRSFTGGALESRADRTISGDSGDTHLTAILEHLSRDPNFFQYETTDMKDINEIAKAVDVGYVATPLGESTTKLNNATKAWEISLPNSKVRVGIIYENANRVWIDVSKLLSGKDRGSAIYAIAADYAHNNDKVLIGDPAGLSRAAFYRRNESMLSSALKHGTTKHLSPHMAQEIPTEFYIGGEAEFGRKVRPINWINGDHIHNIKELAYNSYHSAIANIPEIKDVIYSPEHGRFETTDGREFTNRDFEILLSNYYGRAASQGGLGAASDSASDSSNVTPSAYITYRAGISTAKRAAFFNTFLRSESKGLRARLLGDAISELQGRGLNKSLKGMMYSEPASSSHTSETPESIRMAFVKAFGGKSISQLESNNLISIVANASELPTGVTISKTGIAVFAGNKAYFIADRMNAKDAHQALLHEIGEHYGLEKMLGVEGYDTLIARVRELQNTDPTIQAAWSFVQKNYPSLATDSKAFMHEVLAQIGQNAEIAQRPWWKQVIEAVKRFMIKLGFTGMVKVSDIQDLVLHSLRVAANTGTDDNRTSQASLFDAAPQYSNKPDESIPDSPAFKSWFGDSKVVDEDGNPLVVYHGTTANFDSFSHDKKGSNTGWDNTVHGFFFIADEKLAREFAEENGSGGDVIVKAVYLSIKNPMDLRNTSIFRKAEQASDIVEFITDGEEKLSNSAALEWLNQEIGLGEYSELQESLQTEAFNEFLKGKGYDGIISNFGDGHAEYVAFEPNQIKSATDNNGAYSSSDNILESRGNFMDGLNMDNIAETAKRNFMDAIKSKATFNNWWHKGAGTQYHKAQVDPEHFGKVFNMAQLFIRDLARYANTAADEAPNLLPKMDSVGDAIRGFGTISRDDADAKSIAEPIFQGTLNDKVYSDEELINDFNLNDRQVGLYREFRAAVDKSLDDLAISEMGRLAKTEKIPTAPAGLSLDETAAYYLEHYEADLEKAKLALADLKERQAEENAMLKDASQDLSTEKRVEMLLAMRDRHAKELEQANALIGNFSELNLGIVDKAKKINHLKDSGYAPLMRFGKYTVDVYVAGKDGTVSKNADGEDDRQFFGMFESEAEANKTARMLQEEYPDSVVTQGILSQESASLFKGVTPETVELFAKLAGDSQSEAFQKYLKMAVNNRSAMKRLIKRNGTKGFSENPTRVLASFITSNARAAASNDYFGDMLKAASDIPKHKGDVKDEAIKLMNYIQNPQDESSTLRGLLFMNFLGGSVASALVNMTQPILQTFPYLHQFSPSAAKHLAWAMKVSSKKLIGKDVSLDDPAMTEALQRAADEGVTSPHEIHMLYGEASRTSGYAGSRIMRNITKVWGGFFAVAEEFNRNATFIAAFKIAQERGLEGDEAYQFCKKAVDETQGIYNKANKPNWARGSIGGVLFTFKQFSVSYLEFLKRLPAKERSLALAVLILASGTSGLPASDDLDDLIDTLMQSLGFNWNTKQEKMDFVAKFIGKEASQYVTYGVSHGLPFDVSGRLGLGNLLPATGLLKKSETDKTRDVSDFFGAAGGLLTNYTTAFEKAQAGNFTDAAKALAPKAISDITKGIDMLNTGEAHDAKGRKVADVTPLDAAIKMIGFNPEHIAEGTHARSIMQQNSNLLKATQSNIKELWSQGAAQGDKDKIAAAKAEMERWNKANPDEQISVKISDIQRRVRAMKQSSNERFIKAAPKSLRDKISSELND